MSLNVRTLFVAIVVLVLGTFAVGPFLRADPPESPVVRRDFTKKTLKSREILEILRTPISTEGFHEKLTLQEAVELLRKRLRERGHDVPIMLNTAAFKDFAPDAPDPFTCDVWLPSEIKTMTAGQALRSMVSLYPPSVGTVTIGPGHVLITTFDDAAFGGLSQPLDKRFEHRTVRDALEDLYEETGVNIVLDARVAHRARTVFCARFTNGATVGDAVRVILHMADLDLVVIGRVLFATTPAEAAKIRRLVGHWYEWIPSGKIIEPAA